MVFGNRSPPYTGFARITDDNILVVGSLTGPEAESLGVRDCLTFTPVPAVNDEAQNSRLVPGGPNPRPGIGQRADGAILMVVVDGRQPGSIGASYADMAALMVEYGAVNACNLDGGSSCVLMVEGELINHCTGLSGPRRLPTYFGISPLSE